MTRLVAEVKRPKAIPELATRWIESGPTTRADPSSLRLPTTTCLVSWSPVTAAATTAESPAHCQAPAASERSADEIGAPPWAVDPTRMSGWSLAISPANVADEVKGCWGKWLVLE